MKHIIIALLLIVSLFIGCSEKDNIVSNPVSKDSLIISLDSLRLEYIDFETHLSIPITETTSYRITWDSILTNSANYGMIQVLWYTQATTMELATYNLNEFSNLNHYNEVFGRLEHLTEQDSLQIYLYGNTAYPTNFIQINNIKIYKSEQ